MPCQQLKCYFPGPLTHTSQMMHTQLETNESIFEDEFMHYIFRGLRTKRMYPKMINYSLKVPKKGVAEKMKVNTACKYAIILNVCSSLSLISTTFLTKEGSHA